MNSWLVWGIFAMAAVSLGWVGYHFTVRTLRLVTLALVLAVVVLVTGYGVAHPPPAPTDFVNGFIRGFDDLSVAFFRPLVPGHMVPTPGRFGWLVIIAVFMFAYRELEAWALRWQPPAVDTSALGGSESSAQKNSAPGNGWSAEQREHDRLAAELRFRLPAVEVRAPPILPGGAMPNGLASVAEDSGMTGGGLAGAIIRVLGLLWPTPRRYQVRVWVKLADSPAAANSSGRMGQQSWRADKRSAGGGGSVVASMRVTVDIEDARTGGSIATKTLAARDVDDAAARVAAYVARQIFREDPTVPPWSVGSFDGSDLAALLCAKQGQELIDCPDDAHKARCRQIEHLKEAVGNSPGAGVARYELALLYDLERRHLEALFLHAINREQYPRFFRGRYRLGMSLEMIASPEFPWDKEAAHKLGDSLEILDRCGATDGRERNISAEKLSPALREELLETAMTELRACQRELPLWRLVWEAFWHRDERAMRKPYLRLRERQRFQDGCRVAELLVAVRQRLNKQECSQLGEDPRQLGEDPRQASKERSHPKKARLRPRKAKRIISTFTGDVTAIDKVFTPPKENTSSDPPKKTPDGDTRKLPAPSRKKRPPSTRAGKTRWLPWQHRTPSWEAAYNAACLYAALACSKKYQHNEKVLKDPMDSVIDSLTRVVNDRHCEMERPSDWISTDPDLHCLYQQKDLYKSECFDKFLGNQRQKDYPQANFDAGRVRRVLRMVYLYATEDSRLPMIR